MNYLDFLQSKIDIAPESGFTITPDDVNPILKPHQRDAVMWAVKGGRRALFEAFGLGKTMQELEYSRIISERTGGQPLITMPLGVKQEFYRDALDKLKIPAPEYVRSMDEIQRSKNQILITNYERVRDGDIDPTYFTAAAGLDEASVLRSFGSKTYQVFLDKFKGIPFKLVATATPAPNKYKELIQTVDTSNRYGLAAATLIQTGYGERKGQAPRVPGLNKPLGTVVSTGKQAAVTAFLSKYYGGGYKGSGSAADKPLPTVTAIDHNAVISANIVQLNNNCVGQPVTEPLRTITSGAGHFAEVQALLIKFYGQGTGQAVDKPLDTVTAKDRFGLVTIYGVDYMIVDIGLRMLSPRELYAAQGFPPDYEIETDCNGRHISKTEQTQKCGNSVPPPFATALARANWPEKCQKNIYTMSELNDTIAV